MKADMLVKLYDLIDDCGYLKNLKRQGISVKRGLAPDKHRIMEYVKNHFNSSWASECDVAFSKHPVSCFIAVKDQQVIGFACYDATAKGFFGPTGVSAEFRGLGVGKALLMQALLSMREEGYGYAIIGCVDDAQTFYKKTVNAMIIEDSFPGIYGRTVNID